MRHFEQPKSGFTLLELIVVLAIIGMLSALIIPRLSSIGLAQLRSEARRIRSLIQACYDLSVLEKTNYRLAINLDEQCIEPQQRQADRYEPVQNPLLQRHCLAPEVTIQEFETPDRKIAGAGEDYLYFTPFGYVEPARIFITDTSGNSFTLFTQPLTGEVEIFAGRVEFKDYEEQR